MGQQIRPYMDRVTLQTMLLIRQLLFSNRNGSDVADARRVGQRLQGIALRDEFMSDVAAESGFGDGLHDGRVIQLLRVVNLISARVATGVGGRLSIW